MDGSKEVMLDDLPKEELIKKCKRLLLLAQRAKQAKDECADELKKSKEEADKLRLEVSTVQEVLNSVAERQKEAIEEQNQVKTLRIKNAELEEKIERAKADVTEKENENVALQKTLENVNLKISAFEIRTSEQDEKLSRLEKDYQSVLVEKAEMEVKNLELKTKLKTVEEKYTLVDVKLVEFQDKYIEEKKKHATLENLLEKLEEKSEKSSSERSESRDGLQTVTETHELEAVSQKLDETVDVCERYKSENEALKRQIETIRQQLSSENNINARLQESHRQVVEKCLVQCKELSECCSKVSSDYVLLEEKCKSLEQDLTVNTNTTTELKEAKDRLNKLNLVSEQLAQITATNRALQLRVSSLEDELGSCASRLAEAEALHIEDQEKIAEFMNEIKTLKNNLDDAESNLGSSKRNEVVKLQAVIENLNRQLECLREENSVADKKFIDLQGRLAESNRVSESLEAMVNQRCKEYDTFKQKVEAYDRLAPYLQKLWTDVTAAKEAFSSLKVGVEADLSSLRNDQDGLRTGLSQTVEAFASKLFESNAELLTEMNEMNQVLKERGETISHLEEACTALRTDATESEGRAKKMADKLGTAQEEMTTLRTQLDARDKGLRDMEEEIWRLRNADSPGDALSSSTISKVEESQRLVDLEESFEEKYNKLKILALKLKKKVIEVQGQVDQERAKLIGERADSQAKLAAFQAQTKALNSLQSDYDSLQDKSDAERREAADLRKALNKARDESVLLKQSLEELKADHSKFKQEKATFEMIKKELSGQIQSQKKALEKEKEKNKEWSRQREAWEQEKLALERRLEEEKEKHRLTVASLDEERLKQKKQSLLSLEMADYERTVTDLSRKLDAKAGQVRELSASLETQRELSGTLQAAVADLESRVASEQAAVDAAKLRHGALQDELRSLRSELMNKTLAVAEVERIAQERALELDATKLEASATAAEFAKLEEKYRTVQDSARHEIRGLEDKLAQLQGLVELKELELEELRKEFDSYKVRAQSVLRKTQSGGPPGRQQDVEEEVVQLRASCDALRTKLEDAVKRLQVTAEENAAAAEEKARLTRKVHELQAEIVRLNAANAVLQAAEQRARELGEEAARLLPVQQETLAQCYRKEMEEMEKRYREELEAAQAAQHKAETALQLHVGPQPSPTHRRQPSTGNADTSHRRQPSTGFVPVRTERETLDVLMLEREACEGSESVDSSSPRVLPLEQLLAPQPPVAANLDTSQLADQLAKSESRIHHLTSLLSDAEGDAARLQQLNQVLKEEIRRKERNVAREEHAGNLEYLKNVIVKFATLPRGDERLRLVPVLNTILKLSREEEQRLSSAARGDGGAAGWGSYLGGMWSATQ